MPGLIWTLRPSVQGPCINCSFFKLLQFNVILVVNILKYEQTLISNTLLYQWSIRNCSYVSYKKVFSETDLQIKANLNDVTEYLLSWLPKYRNLAKVETLKYNKQSNKNSRSAGTICCHFPPLVPVISTILYTMTHEHFNIKHIKQSIHSKYTTDIIWF